MPVARGALMGTAPTDPSDAVAIGVVIPYYQRQPGLLARALRSVAGQSRPPRQVVVIDDGAPRAAADELTPDLRAALPQLLVVRQANGGAAAARNAGLDALGADVTSVAFLDSDDHWMPGHLASASAALARGADFYFANFVREGEPLDAWRETGYPDLSHSVAVEESPGLHRWTGGASALMTPGPPFATSTVVYRRGLLPQLRFSSRYRRAGEDAIAWWELLVRASTILLSRQPSAVFGRGISIWSSSTFGSPANLERLADEIAFRRLIMRRFPVAAGDRRVFRAAIRERRAEAAASVLHLLHHRQRAWSEIGYLLRTDPACVLHGAVALPSLTVRWLRARSDR